MSRSTPITFQHCESITAEDLTSSTSCELLIAEDMERNVFVNAFERAPWRSEAGSGNKWKERAENSTGYCSSRKATVFSVTKSHECRSQPAHCVNTLSSKCEIKLV